MQHQPLFETTHIGHLQLNNRIVMAPMTRSRTSQPGNIPTALMAQYYSLRRYLPATRIILGINPICSAKSIGDAPRFNNTLTNNSQSK